MRSLHLRQLSNNSDTARNSSEPFCLLVPSELLSCYTLAMPDAPRRKWTSMIPWMLEDKLLQPASELHFAWSDADKKQRSVAVWVVNKALLQEWTEQSQSYGTLSAIQPDVLSVPFSDSANQDSSSWSLQIDGDRALVRTGLSSGYACPSDWLAAMLGNDSEGATTSNFAERPDSIRVFAESVDSVPGALESLTDISVKPQIGARTASEADPKLINLLPEVTRTRIKSDAKEARLWIPAAAIFVIALLSWPLKMWVEAQHLEEQAAEIENFLAAQYQNLTGQAAQADGASLAAAFEREGDAQLLRQRSMEEGAYPILHSIDSHISACSSCDIKSIETSVGSPNELTLVLNRGNSLQESLDRDGIDYDVEAVEADPELVRLLIKSIRSGSAGGSGDA